jgi:hypothetical protein
MLSILGSSPTLNSGSPESLLFQQVFVIFLSLYADVGAVP